MAELHETPARRPAGRTARRRGGALATAAVAALALAGALLLRRPAPPPDPAARLAAGRALFAANCLHCHHEIRLERRVAGWDERRAFDAVGRLPELNRAMPHFAFTDDERRALATYVVAVGRGVERVPR